MIQVVAKNLVKEGKTQEFLSTAARLVKETNEKDAGCIGYELFQDTGNPRIFTFIEQWESREALSRHMASDHFKALVPLLGRYTEAPGEANIYQKVSHV